MSMMFAMCVWKNSHINHMIMRMQLIKWVVSLMGDYNQLQYRQL